MDQYLNLVKSEKYVLVDFYADWCGPCRQMKPHLDAFASENSDKVEVIRIHADDNKSLLQALLVDELPTLYLYKNEQITWRHIGFIDKVGLLSQIK
jgi:thioredoxin